MGTQIFTDVRLGTWLGTNICLHYDGAKRHVPFPPHGVARMVCENWGTPYAELRAILASCHIGTGAANYVSFYLYPDLECSLISRKLAIGFGLTPLLPIGLIPVQLPFSAVMPSVVAPIPVSGFVDAAIHLDCPFSVRPRPLSANKMYRFFIPMCSSEKEEDEVAVFGRDVISDMLLLYQGIKHPLLRNGPKESRFYYGDNG